MNSARYTQIDRELSQLIIYGGGKSPTFDGVVNIGDGATATSSGSANNDVPMIKNSNGSDTIVSSNNGTSSSKSKKKRKKKASTLNVPQKLTVLAPSDNPLLFLRPEFRPDAYVPTKFTTSDGQKGLFQELERLAQASQKQCGDPYIASEIFSKLLFFPVEIRYVFLMHLIKNPFPDHQYNFVNLWKVIPLPAQKEDRGNFILIMLDMIKALADMNILWQQVVHQPVSTVSREETDDVRIEKKKKAGHHALNNIPLQFHLPNACTSQSELPFPRILIANLRIYKDVIPDKIRLENGLCWGRGEITTEQQLWIQGWWNVAHSFITGCRTVKMLAESIASANRSGEEQSSKNTAALKCFLEQLRGFSESESVTSDVGTGRLHSEVLSRSVPFGSHVLFEKTVTRMMPPRGHPDSDDDEDKAEGQEKKEDGNNGRFFEVKTKYYPCCSTLAYAMDCELAEV